MNPEEFVKWMEKGYLKKKKPTQKEWEKIASELSLVFNKITPYYPKSKSDNKPRACSGIVFNKNKIC
jgi:hypothetical protein